MKNSILITIAIIITSIIACRKHYAEDDSYTLRSPYHRLTNGKWVIQKVEIDGIDSTLAYLNEINFENAILFKNKKETCDRSRVQSSYWIVSKRQTGKIFYDLPFSSCLNGNPGVSIWKFDKQNSLLIMNDFMIIPYSFFPNGNPTTIYRYNFIELIYSIKKLTDSELILETDSKSRHFRFTFSH